MDLRDRKPADLPGLGALLRRLPEVDGYPTVRPGDVSRWLARATACIMCGSPMPAAPSWVTSLWPRWAGRPRWTAATRQPVERLAEVPRLFVAPGTRGTGVGRRLLQHAADAAHHLELWPVLDVGQDGRPGASRLYEAAGWQLVGATPLRLAPDVVLTFGCWIGPAPGSGTC